MKELVEKRNELKAKQDALGKIFAEAGPDMDMSKIKSIEGTALEKVEKIRQLNEELNRLGAEVESLAAVEKAQADQKRRQGLMDGDAQKMRHAEPDGNGNGSSGESKPVVKSFGQMFVESNVYKMRKHPGIQEEFPDFEMKTLFETGAGWAPESMRTGRIVEYPTRPIRMIDVLPMGNTGQAAVVYMEETTATFSAAEKAEGAAYAEAAFALSEQSETVRKITTSVPVTDEQLDDVAQVQGYLDRRLRYDLLRRLDGQILTGTGVAPNLTGINNKASVQTQAKGADPVPDAIRKGITLVRVTGRADPNVIVMHPNDWQDVTLIRTADGIYLWGNPSGPVTQRIWGLPVVETDAQTENTAIVGDFANFAELVTRKGVDVAIGYVGDNFKEGKKTIRADMRAALLWYRAAAFCLVTGV